MPFEMAVAAMIMSASGVRIDLVITCFLGCSQPTGRTHLKYEAFHV